MSKRIARGFPWLLTVACAGSLCVTQSAQSQTVSTPPLATGQPVNNLTPSLALAIDNVTIVDPRDGSTRSGMTIQMLGGKIVNITPTPMSVVLSGNRVNGQGKFVVPGYNNMHSHMLGPLDPSGAMALLLAEGVTGFRQMSSSAQLLLQRRTGTLPLGYNTPTLLTMSSEVLTPFNAGSTTASQILINQQKLLGADFIKVAILRPDVFYSVIAQARTAGFAAVGHLQNGTDALLASNLGYRAIEHLGTGEPIWDTCSRNKEAMIAEAALHPLLPEPELLVPVPGTDLLTSTVLKQRLVNPAAYDSAENVARLQLAFDTYDQARCRELVSAFVANSTWNVPTLVRLRTQYLADDPAYQTDPQLAYMPEENVRDWQTSVATFRALPPAQLATYREAYTRNVQMVKMMADAGVPMLTGVDDGGLSLPGMTLQQEFDELTKAGLSPLKILQMATYNAAIALGRTDRMGLVAIGYDADLVMLDGNPATDATNFRRISAVIHGGYYRSAEDLAALKARVAAGHGYLR